MNYDFNKDLEAGKETELEIAEYLRKDGWTVIEQREDAKYDLLVRKQVKVEVKTDFRCAETGSVFVEYFSRGKPSGLAITEADVYIYKLHLPNQVRFFAVTPKALKDAIRARKHWKLVVGGDPGSETKGALFKLSIFLGLGKLL